MTAERSRAEIVIDVAAVRHNVSTLAQLVAPAAVMTVVKADGYGHGMVPMAQAARAAGSLWLGVATLDEAVALRDSGDTGRILCWLTVPRDDWRPALARDIDVTAYTLAELDAIAAAAAELGVTTRVQLKVDTGLSRGGASLSLWRELVEAARRHEQAGALVITGVWSHFAASDEPDHPANALQEQRFDDALAVAADAGLRPEVTHLANSAAAILRPSARRDLVRIGLAAYGLDPAPGNTPELGLIPAMTVRADLASVKQIAAGEGVSYGHTWVAEHDTIVGLVPVGYAEGVPVHASSLVEVAINGSRAPLRGRVCMDQFVVELSTPAAPGDDVVLFGSGANGEPTATGWAQAIGTINYEIVTRVGGRLTRRYVDSQERG